MAISITRLSESIDLILNLQPTEQEANDPIPITTKRKRKTETQTKRERDREK